MLREDEGEGVLVTDLDWSPIHVLSQPAVH
jgi:hypothetical protein